jgi:hypothetical protein
VAGIDSTWEKPTWTSPSFLAYTGGLTVLVAALAALGYLAGQYGDAAFAAWALGVFAVLAAIAQATARSDRRLTAGVFAFAAVVAWAVFVGALWAWFGWLHSAAAGAPFRGFSVARLALELIVLFAAGAASGATRSPFPVSLSVVVAWLFVTDLVSGGGNWSAVVTLLVGLFYLLVGLVSRGPAAFWFHLAAGLLVGGSLVYWWHGGDGSWVIVAVVALLYVLLARGTNRSSWAVLGAAGLLAAASHFAQSWSHGGPGTSLSAGGGLVEIPYRGWVPPLVFACTGFLLVALGAFVARRPGE